jgi:hypothetical protein
MCECMCVSMSVCLWVFKTNDSNQNEFKKCLIQLLSATKIEFLLLHFHFSALMEFDQVSPLMFDLQIVSH